MIIKSLKKRKRIILLLNMFLFCLILCIFSCNKEDSGNLTNDLRNATSYDINSLMKEKVVIEMLNELKPYSFKVNRRGILEFTSAEELRSVLTILSKYSNQLDDPKDIYPNDPVLFAFEYYYGFYSLRQDIEAKVLMLEVKDALFEYNNPEDDKIVGDEFRAILTPDKKLVVDELIIIYYDSMTVGVFNYNYEIVSELDDAYDNNGVSGVIGLSTNQDVMVLHSDIELRSVTLDFSYTNYNNDAHTYRFNPIIQHTTENPNYFSYSWDFGDNSTSTQKNPVHTFSGAGSYYVQLTVSYGGSTYISGQEINIGGCNANFTFTEDPITTGKYHFTNTSESSNGSITSYAWTFGNVSTSTAENPTYSFNQDNTYYVKLVVSTDNNCSDFYERLINVSGIGDCCQFYDREKDTTYKYANNTRQAKLTLKIVNLFPINGYMAKTVNYRVRDNGSLVRENADIIRTCVGGRLYNSNCVAFTDPVSGSDRQENKNKAKVTNYNLVSPIRVKKASVYSTCEILDNDDELSGSGLSIHQNNCN
jgi:PKD repeat protein